MGTKGSVKQKKIRHVHLESSVMTFSDVIKKHFGDDRTKYFHSSDALKVKEGDTYLGYYKRPDGSIELNFGGDNGEMCLRVCRTPQELNVLVEALIYSKGR